MKIQNDFYIHALMHRLQILLEKKTKEKKRKSQGKFKKK